MSNDWNQHCEYCDLTEKINSKILVNTNDNLMSNFGLLNWLKEKNDCVGAVVISFK